MTRRFHHVRRAVIAFLAVATVAGVSTAPASAAQRTLTFQCAYPLIGDVPVTATITAGVPQNVPVGSPTAAWSLDVSSVSAGQTYDGFSLLGSVFVESETTLGLTVDTSSGMSLPIRSRIANDRILVPLVPGDLTYRASGQFPQLTFDADGSGRISVASLDLSVSAIREDGTAIIFPGSDTDSDRDPETFDVPCRLDPPDQDRSLASFAIGSGTVPSTPPSTPATTAPTTPAATTPPPTTPSSSRTINYQCTYPLIGEAPVALDVRTAIPSSVPVGSTTTSWGYDISAVLGGNSYTGFSLIGADTVNGSILARSTVNLPGGLALPVSVPTRVDPYDVPNTPGDLTLHSSGQSPALTFPTAGAASVTLDQLSFSLRAIKADGTAVIFPGSDTDSDHDIDTFDVTCRLDPAGQDTLLARITITSATTTTPNTNPPVTSPPVTTPSVTTPKTTPVTTPKTTPTVTTPVTNPPVTTPKTTPSVTTPTPPTTPKTTPTTTPPTTPGGGCACVTWDYGIAGTATMRTLVKGTMPVAGQIRAVFSLATGQFSADLTLRQAPVKLKTLGFLPVLGKLELTTTQKATGTYQNGMFSLSAVLRIKLASVTLFGLELADGASCQARQSSNLVLKTAEQFFNPRTGGTLAGMFPVSDLVGCAFMNGMVSSATTAKANAIAVKFTL